MAEKPIPLTVDEARIKHVCRLCGEPAKPRPDDPFIMDFGFEYAHQSCLRNEGFEQHVAELFQWQQDANTEPVVSPRVAELEAENAMLPRTADGALLTIGMDVWKPNYNPAGELIHRQVESLVLNKHGWSVRTRWPGKSHWEALAYSPHELYSTEEAVREAKEASDG